MNATDDLQNNLYIKILELGIERTLDGISFNEVRSKINQDLPLGMNLFDGTLNIPLMDWFFENYYVTGVEKYKSESIGNPGNQIINVYRQHLDTKAYLKGDAIMKYLEYTELRQAYRSSKQAHKIALWAIYISAAIAMFGVGVQLSQILGI